MQIQIMTLNDLPRIMELEVKQHKPWPAYGFGQALRLGHFCRIVEHDGKLLGYGVANGGHGRTICATNGKAALLIYRAWFDHAKQVGAPILWAETDKDNVEAISMLVRFGFTKSGTRPNFYGVGIDAIVWTRSNPTEEIIGVQGRPAFQVAESV